MKQFLIKWWVLIVGIILILGYCLSISYRNVDDIKRDAKDVIIIENAEIVSYEGSNWSIISGGSCDYTVKKISRPNELFLIQIEKNDDEYSIFWMKRINQPQKSE